MAVHYTVIELIRQKFVQICAGLWGPMRYRVVGLCHPHSAEVRNP